ncbi:MAG: methylated-DNA--[protein]-cysteine S-methyltransferase [Polyangiaceae bacterium]
MPTSRTTSAHTSRPPSGEPRSLDVEGWTTFETKVGACAIAWSRDRVVRIFLPEEDAKSLESKARTSFGSPRSAKSPAPIAKAIGAIVKHLEGAKVDLLAVPLALDHLPTFRRRVYDEARRIPPGTTLSYVELATRAGSPGASRAVGQAMAKNPYPIVVPCHRVLAAGGRAGGFSAFGGRDTKSRLLACEGYELVTPSRGKLPFDVALAVKTLRENDPALRKLIDAVGPCTWTVAEMQSPFDALAESIVYQQLTGKAAATIFARVCALFDASRRPTAKELAKVSEADLRTAGLSNAKTRALKDLAAHALRGEIPDLKALQKMDEDAIKECLTRVRGIGPWTVEMMMMFRLGRPDVMPSSDFGVRKGFEITYRTAELPAPGVVEARAERWKPYRSVASWYMWRAVDRAKAEAGKKASGRSSG